MLRVGIVAAIFILGSLIAAYIITDVNERNEETLPVIQPTDVNPILVDDMLKHRAKGHSITDFQLTDHKGNDVDQGIVKDKVYVADFFFTTCGGICPKMTTQLTRVQKAFENDGEFIILSHSVWPEKDTVEALDAYAARFQAQYPQWRFLTGNKAHIYELARKQYFTLKPAEVKGQGDGNSDFIHTSNFVLVDRKGRIRGYYDGTSNGEVSQLIRDARFLLDHPEK